MMKKLTKEEVEMIENILRTVNLSQDEYMNNFIDAVVETFDNGLVVTIDTKSIKEQIKDLGITFDMQGPVCSDNALMTIFKKADYLHVYNDSDDWLYGAIYQICNDFVIKCAKLAKFKYDKYSK